VHTGFGREAYIGERSLGDLDLDGRIMLNGSWIGLM
jgi:hypothetical protein